MAAVYLLSGIVSLSIFHEYSIITMSAFFPEGFALAGVLLFGKRVLPGIFLGQLLLALYSGFPLLAGIEIGISNTIEAYMALLLFRHFKLDSHLHDLRDLFGILILVMLVLQPFSALAGNTILYLNGIVSVNELSSSIFYWWIGNVLGQMLLTPMLLLLYHNRKDLDIRAIAMVVIVTIILNYLFQVVMEIHNTSLLLILTLPATIYLSTRNINYASISSVLLASISLYFAQKGIGTFSHNPSMVDNLLNLNYFMASHVILVLLVGVLFKEKEEAIELLRKMAHVDALTGLPNRHLLREEIHHAVSMSDQYGDRSAVCYIDLDHLKPVNDTLGHHVGDEVLKIIASRIKREITARDALLRIGGDEFLLILNKITDTQSVEETLKRITLSISKPITVEKNTLHLSCSIGVSFCPDHGVTIKTLMENADKAMYMAKASQRGSIFITDIPKAK
jgi:diguanylate cyclase (GGDEF)-like protein